MIPNLNLQNELPWIKEAKKHLGLREIAGAKHNPTILNWIKNLKGFFKDDETPWCGTFVAHCLKTAGVSYPKNWFRALDYRTAGSKLAKPAYGCVAIKSRVGGGHVCFVVGKDRNGNLLCLGGNQSNMVNITKYKASDFVEFRWYGKTDSPANFRYELPLLDVVAANKGSEA